jgi:glycine betaine/proline transport system ATP-binding protein
VGTPEEVVAHPADGYVADFTRDVPRAHVLTARTIMGPAPSGDGRTYASDVAPDTVVQDLLPLVVESELPLRVVEGGAMIGVVDRVAVMQALMEEGG